MPLPDQGGAGRMKAEPVGSGDYVVREGQCINSIALENGLFWETLWNLPENSELRSARSDPDALMPGDRLTVPAVRVKQVDCGPEQTHAFKRKGVPAWLRLRFCDEDEPLADVPFRVEVDGEIIKEDKLDSDGRLEVAIPPAGRQALVTLEREDESESYTFDLGTIPPINSPAGVRRRLVNLGFAIEDESEDALLAGIASFQRSQELDSTGAFDEQTRSALLEAHGS
ncbi:LysM domain-containing protein [Phycisphaeraceae bacterium D3-23]